MFIEVRRFNGYDVPGDDESAGVLVSFVHPLMKVLNWSCSRPSWTLSPTDRETGCLKGDVDVHSRKGALNHVKDRRRESCLLVRAAEAPRHSPGYLLGDDQSISARL